LNHIQGVFKKFEFEGTPPPKLTNQQSTPRFSSSPKLHLRQIFCHETYGSFSLASKSDENTCLACLTEQSIWIFNSIQNINFFSSFFLQKSLFGTLKIIFLKFLQDTSKPVLYFNSCMKSHNILSQFERSRQLLLFLPKLSNSLSRAKTTIGVSIGFPITSWTCHHETYVTIGLKI